MKAQAFQCNKQADMTIGKKTPEINPKHPVLNDFFLTKVKADKVDIAAMNTAIVDEKTAEVNAECERKVLEEMLHEERNS